MKLTQEQVARLRWLERDGRLTVPEVLADAKDPASPLHTLYDWDAGRAAEAHWRAVTREVIGSVRLQVATEEHIVRVPAYTRDPAVPGDESGYVAVSVLRDSRDRSRDALADEFGRAAGHLRRALGLSVALGLEAEVDELLGRLLGLQRRLLPPPAAGAEAELVQ